jgi:hypothetical protein
MKSPASNWKYELGFLTVVRRGSPHELGYFGSREAARKAAMIFLAAPGSGEKAGMASAAMAPAAGQASG